MRKHTYTNAKKNGRIVRMNPKEETFKAIGVFITPQSRSIKAIRDKSVGILHNVGCGMNAFTFSPSGGGRQAACETTRLSPASRISRP